MDGRSDRRHRSAKRQPTPKVGLGDDLRRGPQIGDAGARDELQGDLETGVGSRVGETALKDVHWLSPDGAEMDAAAWGDGEQITTLVPLGDDDGVWSAALSGSFNPKQVYFVGFEAPKNDPEQTIACYALFTR